MQGHRDVHPLMTNEMLSCYWLNVDWNRLPGPGFLPRKDKTTKMECAKINVIYFMDVGSGFLQLANSIGQLANDCHIQQHSNQFIQLASHASCSLTIHCSGVGVE